MNKDLTFKDLNQNAKDHVLEKERYLNVDYEWWDGITERLKEAGIDAEHVYFDLQSGYFYADKADVDKEKLISAMWRERYIGAQEAYAMRDHFYIGLRTTYHGCGFGQNFFELEVEDDVPEEVAKNVEGGIDAFLDDLINKCLKELRDEYDYLTSDESVTETIEANEWRFTPDGERA